MDFPTRKSYLEWRTVKRIEYIMVSGYLRDLKDEISNTMRQSAHTITCEQQATASQNRRSKIRPLSTVVQQNTQLFLRKKATTIMNERRAAKEIARALAKKGRESNA